MRTRWKRYVPGFFRDRTGVAAVEFALLAPLLCLVLGVSVEVGRMVIIYRQFEDVVIGLSRHVARYPEYEYRAREYARPMPSALFPGGDIAALNVMVNGLVKRPGDSIMTEIFPGNILFGSNPNMPWQDYVNANAYADDEAMIFVAASYVYRPIMSFVPSLSITFRKDVQIMPSFGRSYPWNDGQVDDSKYVY